MSIANLTYGILLTDSTTESPESLEEFCLSKLDTVLADSDLVYQQLAADLGLTRLQAHTVSGLDVQKLLCI